MLEFPWRPRRTLSWTVCIILLAGRRGRPQLHHALQQYAQALVAVQAAGGKGGVVRDEHIRPGVFGEHQLRRADIHSGGHFLDAARVKDDRRILRQIGEAGPSDARSAGSLCRSIHSLLICR